MITSPSYFYSALAFVFVLVGCTFTGGSANFKEYGSWPVRGGQLTWQNTKEDALANAYWQVIYPLLPQDILDQYLVDLTLYTDGKGGELGAIDQQDESNAQFRLNLDIKDVDLFSKNHFMRTDAYHTLIHEFGHLLTLNDQQVDVEINDTDQSRYILDEGQAKSGSYLNLFVNEFWTASMLDEWYDIQAIESLHKKDKLIYRFYQRQSDQFVTEYSSEGPEEDIAESWTFFVFNDKPQGDSIRERKVRFFYQFPELVRYRDSIRAALDVIPENDLN